MGNLVMALAYRLVSLLTSDCQVQGLIALLNWQFGLGGLGCSVLSIGLLHTGTLYALPSMSP